jgi:hypothetical protein
VFESFLNGFVCFLRSLCYELYSISLLIDSWKKKLEQNHGEFTLRNKELRTQKEAIVRHCVGLKARMKRFRQSEVGKKLILTSAVSQKATSSITHVASLNHYLPMPLLPTTHSPCIVFFLTLPVLTVPLPLLPNTHSSMHSFSSFFQARKLTELTMLSRKALQANEAKLSSAEALLKLAELSVRSAIKAM